jgi:hypothetical protein
VNSVIAALQGSAAAHDDVVTPEPRGTSLLQIAAADPNVSPNG